MSQKQVLVSIINWNNWEDTSLCIQSVLSQNWSNITIRVWDNGSKNQSVNQLRQNFPAIDIVQSSENLGFAGAHFENVKFAESKGFDAIWLLNNDALCQKDTLPAFLRAWKNLGDALYGSVTLEPDGDTIQYAGGYRLTDGKVVSAYYNELKGRSWTQTASSLQTGKVADLHGASLFLPLSVYKKHGFMDTRFFLYAEETDYCFRLRSEGTSCIVVADSIITHASSNSLKSSKKLKYIKAYYSNRNLPYFLKRNKSDFLPTVKVFFSLSTLKNLTKFFLKYWLLGTKEWKRRHKCAYFENLGKLHAWLGIRGRYLNPDKFLEI